jgi:hypothetical protein
MVCAWLGVDRAAAEIDPPARPGIRCARAEARVPPWAQQRLVESLRRITGFVGLHFRPDGDLSLGEPRAFAGGSATARLVLEAVMASGMAFVVEDHSGSGQVHFGQLDEGTIVTDIARPGELLLWRVRLDFEDLAGFSASPAVRAAFDEGFALLHELLHGLGFPDARRPDQLGPVEEILNRARAELALPRRDSYFAEGRRVAEELVSVTLRFRRHEEAAPTQPGRPRRARYEYLSFLVDARTAPEAGEPGLIAAWRRGVR